MADNFKRFYYKTNKFGKLQAFVKVYELETVVKASEALHTSQPAVSMQIKSLEDMLGFKLFEKVGIKLVPTEHCHEFYNSITPYVVGIDEMIENFKNVQHRKTHREVKIAVHHIFITRALGRYLSQLNSKTKIHIFDYGRTETIEKLRKNEIDIAIYPMQDLPSELASVEIASYKPLLVMQKDNPLKDIEKLTPKDIATQSVVRIDPKFIILPLFNEVYKQYKWHTNIKFDSPDWAILMHFVRSKLGVAVVSEICLDDDRDVIFKDLSHIFPDIKYMLAVNKFAFLPNNVLDVVKLFSEEMEKEITKNQ